jgi:hypothetical protein
MGLAMRLAGARGTKALREDGMGALRAPKRRLKTAFGRIYRHLARLRCVSRGCDASRAARCVSRGACISRAREAQKTYEKAEWVYFAHPNEGLKLHLGTFTGILRGHNSRGAMRLARTR